MGFPVALNGLPPQHKVPYIFNFGQPMNTVNLHQLRIRSLYSSQRKRTSKMRFPTTSSSTGITMILAILLSTHLTSSAPTNQTSPTKDILLAISPANIVADTCPTPPTEFLPYSPPPGYVPAPGCPPASQGTQPSEGNPPAGYYGGSGTGSGSSTQYTSSAVDLRGMNPIAKLWRLLFRCREHYKRLSLRTAGFKMLWPMR